jgi:predicted RNA-binding Zn ribbon-like protein
MSGPDSEAPGGLETIRRFVNTRDVEAGTDLITGVGALATWLAESALLSEPAVVESGDVRRAIELRESLRAALAANHDRAPIPAADLATLNAVAGRAGLTVTLTDDGAWRPHVGTPGVDGALGRLLVLMSDAVSDGTWPRLKVCANDACQWAFYDESRARTGRWCSMKICGNRAKQQAWRARHAV